MTPPPKRLPKHLRSLEREFLFVRCDDTHQFDYMSYDGQYFVRTVRGGNGIAARILIYTEYKGVLRKAVRNGPQFRGDLAAYLARRDYAPAIPIHRKIILSALIDDN